MFKIEAPSLVLHIYTVHNTLWLDTQL